MRCRFCFATFQDVKREVLPKGHLPEKDATQVVERLAEAGFSKITFAGGEPLLCPWLPQFITRAKSMGMTTMVVTNGSVLKPSWLASLAGHLDWVTLSIDSLDATTNRQTGRALAGKRPIDRATYRSLTELIKRYAIRLKINAVVHRYNWQEDMTDFIAAVAPERWKVLQVLADEGQNDQHIGDYLISPAQFRAFVQRHTAVGTNMVPETNAQMRGTYVMVDPAGRFFDNTSGRHLYSRPLLDVGVEHVLQEVTTDYSGFLGREGNYNW